MPEKWSPLKVAASAAKPSCLCVPGTRNILITPVTIIYIFTLSLHSQTRVPNVGHCRKSKIKGRPLPYSTHILSHCFVSAKWLPGAALCICEKPERFLIIFQFFFTEFKRFAAIKSFILRLTSQRENCLSMINCGVPQPQWCCLTPVTWGEVTASLTSPH